MNDENIVKKVCKELGVTYKELGEKIGYSENAISNSARGKVSKQLETAIKLYLKNIEYEKELQQFQQFKEFIKNIK